MRVGTGGWGDWRPWKQVFGGVLPQRVRKAMGSVRRAEVQLRKRFLCSFVFKKGAIIVYFHDVGTDQVQRRKVRIRARRGGLEEQCLRVGGEDGTRGPAAGRCSRARAFPAPGPVEGGLQGRDAGRCGGRNAESLGSSLLLASVCSAVICA